MLKNGTFKTKMEPLFFYSILQMFAVLITVAGYHAQSYRRPLWMQVLECNVKEQIAVNNQQVMSLNES